MKSIITALIVIGVFVFSSGVVYSADTTIKGTTSDTTNASLEVTNSSDASLLYVRNDGNVGIGTTAPTRKLYVAGGNDWEGTISADTTAGYSSFALYSAGVRQWSLYRHSDHRLCFSNAAGADKMQIYQDGNVWIAGKLTQAGCPDYSNITPLEFIRESINKTEHVTQEEVDALMRLAIEQAEQIEKLTKQIDALEAKISTGKN